MIGPIAAIIFFIAAGLGLSAWSILRRASRSGADAAEHHGFDALTGEASFVMGVEGQAEISPQGPA